MKWIYITLFILGILILGATIIYKQQLVQVGNIGREYLKGFLSKGTIPIYQTSYTGDYIVLSKSGNESLYEVNITKNKDGTSLICLEAGFDNITIDSKTGSRYVVPEKLSFYKSEELEKQEDLIKTKNELSATSPTNPNKFCYIADPERDFYLKFGDNSIVVIQNSQVYSGNLVNITAETNFTHLTINNLSTNAPYDSLVGYWNFDGDLENTKLTKAYDFTKYNNNGNYTGDVITNNTNCIYGDCAKFDDNADYIFLGNPPSLSLGGNFTISAWINVGSESDYQTIIGISRGSTARNYWFAVFNDGTITLRFVNSTTGGTCSASDNTDLRNDGWNYVVGGYNGTHCYVYLNGIFQTSDVSGYPQTYPTYNVTIGYEYSTAPREFNGSIDEVMIFNTSLTSAQILAIYNNQSARFYSTGTQDIVNQTYMNITTGNNRVNVTTYTENLLGSSINLTVGFYNTSNSWFYTTPQVVSSGIVQIFNISSTSTNLTLNYTFYAGNSTNPFYSPIIQYNITYNYWNVAEGDTTYPQFSNYWDNNASLIDTGIGNFNVTIINTNGTVILHINNTNILAKNMTVNVYNATYNFGIAGNYIYNWTAYGNGTSHLLNISANRYYTVNSSIPETCWTYINNVLFIPNSCGLTKVDDILENIF